MISAAAVIGMDVSRDWPDGFCASSGRHLRLPNTVAGDAQLFVQLRATLVAAGVEAVQLPPAQIEAFALSRGTRARTDRIDAELIARFMLFRPGAGRRLPEENLRVLRTLTTRRARIVDMMGWTPLDGIDVPK